MHCHKCNTLLLQEARYCHQCGHPPPVAPGHESEENEPDGDPNFLTRHWYGRYNLWVSYWIIGILLLLLVSQLIPTFTSWLLTVGQTGAGASVALVGLAYSFFIVFLLWQSVGLWRSAEYYRHKGKFPYLATLAQITLSWWLLYVGYSLGGAGITTLATQEKSPDTAPYAITIHDDSTILEISGKMVFGTAQDIAAHLANLPNVETLRLNTQEGEVQEGLVLYRLIKQNGFMTQTTTECSGPCILAFLGGKERLITEEARMGFHDAATGIMKSSSADWWFDKRIGDVMREQGLPEPFIQQALQASSEKTWYPDHQMLRAAGIITPSRNAQTSRQTLALPPAYRQNNNG